jgi:hypothetical protein
MTPLEFVRKVAEEFDQHPDDNLCEAILWGETTFPMKRIDSEDAFEIEEDFRQQLINFFQSGTKVGQRMDETIERLRAEGNWPTPKDV